MKPNTNTTSNRIFHKFRALSELKDEAKGGYIEMDIKVPPDYSGTIPLGMMFYLKI